MPKYKTGKEKIEKVESNIPEEFRQSLIERKIKPATLKSYVDNDVIPFLAFLKEENNIEFNGVMTRQDIEDYKVYLISKEYRMATFNKKINSLYCFNKYLIEKKIMTEQVVTLKDRMLKIKEMEVVENEEEGMK